LYTTGMMVQLLCGPPPSSILFVAGCRGHPGDIDGTETG
jgi:hypothetical protein